MLNTIRMEWYHLTRMKSFYVALLAAVVLSILAVYADYTTYDDLQKKIHSEITDFSDMENYIPDSDPYVVDADEGSTQFIIGLFSTISEKAFLKSPLEAEDFLLSNLSSGIFLAVLVIIAGLYTASDLRHGYIKNIIGANPHRFVLVLSKMIVMLANTFLVFVVTVLTHLAALFILYEHMSIANPARLLGLLAVQFLLHYAFVLVVMLVVYLTGSGSVGYLFGLLAITNVLAMPLSLINLLIQKYVRGAKDFLIFHYLVTGNTHYITNTVGTAALQRAVIVALVFGCIAIAGSIGIFSKKDIR